MQRQHEIVDGLDGAVTILRDEWGIPHVRATNEHDAFFAQGFVHAQDRLGQMEYDRRRAYGRWAEVAGPPALGFDAFARRLGLRDGARREYDALPADARGVLDAYAAGVNAFLALGRPLPTDLALAEVTPEPWQPWDCNAVFLVRHVVFANWQKKLWRARVAMALGPRAAAVLELDDRLVPVVVPPGEWAPPYGLDPADLGPVLEAMAPFGHVDTEAIPDGGPSGSNAWALSGAHTASGRPLVAGDPHRAIEVPGVYVQNHLACPEFDAIGLAFAGVPGLPHFGHNAHVAWCVTNAYGDYQDLYVERFAEEEAPHRFEMVEVRDAEHVVVECFDTAHGPVVFGDPATGVAIAMQSTALAQPSGGLSALAPMLRVRTVDELRDVMRVWVDPANNLLSADVHGDIAYQTIGSIPVRTVANAWGPVPGWTDAHDWGDPIPYDELPTAKNPDGGTMVSANQRIVGPEYPHHLSDGYSRPDRAERIVERLASLTHATVDDMVAIHRDVVSLRAPVWVARLTALTPHDPFEREALALLAEWDHEVQADSGAAAVLMVVRDSVCRHLAHHLALASLRHPFVDEPSSTFAGAASRIWPMVSALLARDDRTLLLEGESWADVLAGALADAVAILRTTLGDDAAVWRWGALHQNAPQHPLSSAHPEWAGQLDPEPVELAGDWDTVFASSHAVGTSYAVTGGSVARYVFDLANWDASGWIVPLGAHGDSASAHFTDQRALWAEGNLIPMRYDWDVIESAATASIQLQPR